MSPKYTVRTRPAWHKYLLTFVLALATGYGGQYVVLRHLGIVIFSILYHSIRKMGSLPVYSHCYKEVFDTGARCGSRCN